MGAAVMGIYGNSKQEAMYPVYGVDAAGQKLNGANLYPALCAGRITTRPRFLVDDDVRTASEPACGQPDQSLPHQLADVAAAQARCRRRVDTAHPERIPRQR